MKLLCIGITCYELAYWIRTPYGNTYDVTKDGYIVRTDMTLHPSAQWRLIGLQELRATDRLSTRIIPFESLGHFIDSIPSLTFNNGQPRYTVIDFDHGTQRTWGNTRYHGISAIGAY